VARLYPQTPGSLFVASYDSKGYGGGIRTHLHAWRYIRILVIYKNSVRTSQETHFVFITKNNRLTLFREVIAV
jgi:hypothetical protein